MTLLPLALLLTVAILSTTGSTLQDKDVGVKEVFPGVGEYLFSSLPMNWMDAYQFCNRVAGHVAVIDSQAEKEALSAMMVRHGVTSIHLGFDDRSAEGDYYTITDEVVDPSQWAAGFPQGGVAYNCGGFTAQGFVDTDCAKERNTICEFAATRAKPEGYELIPGLSYYKAHKLLTTWPEAREICSSEGAYLHILNSQDEQDQLYKKYDYRSFAWTGVNRLNANNNMEFHTIFGEPLANIGYMTWYNFGPLGNFTTDPYVGSLFDQGLFVGQIHDKFSYICEIDV